MKIANFQLDELLEQVNSCGGLEDVEAALTNLVNKDTYIRAYLDHAVNDQFVNIDLEDLQYKFSDYHRSMAGMLLCSKTSLSIFNDVLLNEKVAMKTRRYQLKNLLEMLHVGEAKILKAIIQKNLTELYPNITHELICKVL